MQFTKREEIDLWSGSFSLEGIEDRKLQEAIEKTVHSDGQNFLWFRSVQDKSITRTRYPRYKYGIPDIEACRRTTRELVQHLWLPDFTEATPRKDTFCRIVMGLREWYDTNAITHTADEVRIILSSQWGDVQEWEIYSVLRWKNPYIEPAAIIWINTANIWAVYELAERFRQERFCVEDLTRMKAYIVETTIASSPASSPDHRD